MGEPTRTHPLQVARDVGAPAAVAESGDLEANCEGTDDATPESPANASHDVVAPSLVAASSGVGAGANSLATGASLVLGPTPIRSAELKIQPSKVFGLRRPLGT